MDKTYIYTHQSMENILDGIKKMADKAPNIEVFRELLSILIQVKKEMHKIDLTTNRTKR